jgi:hypothetical protein
MLTCRRQIALRNADSSKSSVDFLPVYFAEPEAPVGQASVASAASGKSFFLISIYLSDWQIKSRTVSDGRRTT